MNQRYKYFYAARHTMPQSIAEIIQKLLFFPLSLLSYIESRVPALLNGCQALVVNVGLQEFLQLP